MTESSQTANGRAAYVIFSKEPATQPQSHWTSASTPKSVILSPSEGSARSIPRAVFATSLRCCQRDSRFGSSGSVRGSLAQRVTTVASRPDSTVHVVVTRVRIQARQGWCFIGHSEGPESPPLQCPSYATHVGPKPNTILQLSMATATSPTNGLVSCFGVNDPDLPGSSPYALSPGTNSRLA
jgi:hypothetical protein